MKTLSEFLHAKKFDRQARFSAWQALAGYKVVDLAQACGTTPQMICNVKAGIRRPQWLLDCLRELGAPDDVLPAEEEEEDSERTMIA
jgi:hypothetical protein